MEALVIIFVGVLGMILVGSIMGITANSRINRLEKEIASLRHLIISREDAPFQKPVSPRPVAAAAKTMASKAIVETPNKPKATPTIKPKARPKAPLPKTKLLKPKKPKQSLEEMIGAQWSVWVGGLALFLGAVFLLRYTIEAGVFTPAMRIGMASLFGVALLGTGEFLRRADKRVTASSAFAKSLTEHAYIPGVLTAIGIFALLGAVYASYALYSFIGPTPAFALMGVISLAALALGLLHGPKLAALGLAASLITPLLIQTTEPNAYILYGYLTIVSAAALALAKKRDWGWLNILTLFGAMFWIFFSLNATKAVGTHMAWLAFAALMFGVSTYTASRSHIPAEAPKKTKLVYTPVIAALWAALAALAIFASVEQSDYARLHYSTGLGFVGLLIITAWLRPRQSWHALTAGLLGGSLILGAELLGYRWVEVLGTATLLSAAFIAICFTRLSVILPPLSQRSRDILWPTVSIILPIGLFVLLHVSREAVNPHAISALLLGFAAIFAVLAYQLWRKTPSRDVSISIYACGTAISYICAAIIGLDEMGETLALILGIVLSGLAAWKMPITINRMMTAGFGLLTAAHVLLIQIPDTSAIGETVILNALWIYFALPALICAVTAWQLSRDTKDLWSEGLKALSLTFAALFIIFQIRHFMNGGDVLAERLSLDELSLQVLVGLSFTLGGTLIGSHKLNFKAPLHEKFIPMLAMGVSLLTLIIFGLGVCLDKAPLFNSNVIINGGGFFNSLLLAYLLPAILLAAIAWTSKDRRPLPYVQLIAGLGLASFMLYVTSMVRKGFKGTEVSIFKTPPINVELYTISAIWLLIGIGLLVLGIKGKRQDIRFASAIIITLTILKAFLIDMASLEGVLRAMSFVVLGVVLIIIGRAYQRLLFSDKENVEAEV